MTTACPNGHQSETSDYCDQCGARIGGPDPAAAPAAAAPVAPRAGIAGPGPDPGVTLPGAIGAPPAPASSPGASAQGAGAVPVPDNALCPVCWTPRIGEDRFCEGCGYDFVTPAGAAPSPTSGAAAGGWEAVAVADRDYFERIAPEGVSFPPHCPPRIYSLAGDEVRIGRRSNSRGIQPELDLSGAPEDAAISHLHCLLLRQPDGSYSLVDPGSTNGTTLNDDPTPLVANTPVALADGDRIHLGAWTTITVRNRPAADGSGSGS